MHRAPYHLRIKKLLEESMSSVVEGQDTSISEELLGRLKQCTNLPSPPGVAARIIELGQDPTADMGVVADAVSIDPAVCISNRARSV